MASFHENAHLIIFSLPTHYHIVWCRYDAVKFLQNIHKKHLIACPLGRGMGCILWVGSLVDILSDLSSCNDVCNIILYSTVL